LDFNDSWDAVVNPGEGESYFEVHRDKPFEPDAPAYSAVNAWWLAEISRLLYKQGPEEPEPSRGELTRQAALETVGLRETFVSDLQAPFALITPPDLRFRIVAFRGSHNLVNWVTNLDSILTDCTSGGRVHEGFQKALDPVWERLESLLATGSSPLFFTGHSRGAALATLAAARHRQPSPFGGSNTCLSARSLRHLDGDGDAGRDGGDDVGQGKFAFARHLALFETFVVPFLACQAGGAVADLDITD